MNVKEQEELLRQYIEHIEHIQSEKTALFGQLKEIYDEAASKGLDTKALKEIIKLRKLNKDEYNYQASILDQYKRILGMV